MLNWIKKILGIIELEERTEKSYRAVNRIEKKLGMVETKKPQRFDEIERDRKRRKKGGRHEHYTTNHTCK